MKSITQAMLEIIYEKAIELTRKNNQVVHQETSEKTRGSYYITLQQLESILKEFED